MEQCKVCGVPGCIEVRGVDFHAGTAFGGLKCDYSVTPPFGDESFGFCKCPGGADNEVMPTHRIFLMGSHVPTEKELEASVQHVKKLVGKIDFPFQFDPLG